MKAHQRVVLLAIASTVVLAAPARAATYTVTNGSNAAAGSLSDRIEAANAAAGADTIEIETGVIPTLTSTPPQITDQVTIRPKTPGARSEIDLGGQVGLVFNTGSSSSTVTRLDLRNNSPSASFAAVGIRSGVGSVTINDTRIGLLNADGTGDGGGATGISDGGTATLIEDSVISGQNIGLDLSGSGGQVRATASARTRPATAAVANAEGGIRVDGTSVGYQIGTSEKGQRHRRQRALRHQGHRDDQHPQNPGQPDRHHGCGSTARQRRRHSDLRRVEHDHRQNGELIRSQRHRPQRRGRDRDSSVAEHGQLRLHQQHLLQRRHGVSLKSSTAIEPNDAGDVDTGPNGLQNHAVITTARGDVLSGTIDSRAAMATTIDVYSDTVIDQPSGAGELRTWHCRTVVPAGVKTWTCSPTVAIPGGLFASALATTTDGTSEPSPSIVVTPAPVVVAPKDDTVVPVEPVVPVTPTVVPTPAAAITSPTTALAPPVPGYGRTLLGSWASQALLSVRGRNRRGRASLTVTLPAPSGAQPAIYTVSGTARVSRRRTVRLPARTVTVQRGRRAGWCTGCASPGRCARRA
jgi:hypothetical protein